ncbi:hypothetical protein P8452_45468 [Trifolium repens]|nr:hypothetical protein P8452_45468 [Trifolium repens]
MCCCCVFYLGPVRGSAALLVLFLFQLLFFVAFFVGGLWCLVCEPSKTHLRCTSLSLPCIRVSLKNQGRKP